VSEQYIRSVTVWAEFFQFYLKDNVKTHF